MKQGDLLEASSRESMYKNKGLTSAEMRRRRQEVHIGLRRMKRDDNLDRKRHIFSQPFEAVDLSELELEFIDPNRRNTISGIFSSEPVVQANALKNYGKRIVECDGKEAIDEIINLNIFVRILDFLNSADRCVRTRSLFCIGRVIGGCPSQVATVVNGGFLPKIVHYLRSDNEDLRINALYTLCIIVGDDAKYRDSCLMYEIVPKLVTIINDASKREFVGALHLGFILCRSRKPYPNFSSILPLIPVFITHLYSDNRLAVIESCSVIAEILDYASDEHCLEIVSNPKFLERCITLMAMNDVAIALPAMIAIGNAVSGNDKQMQVILACWKILSTLHELLLCSNNQLKKEACRVLSNIAAGNHERIQKLFDANILPTVIHILSWGSYKLRREACWIVVNIAIGGRLEQCAELVRLGVIPHFCDLLTVMEPDVVLMSLNSIDRILACGDELKEEMAQNPHISALEEARGIEKINFLSMSNCKDVAIVATELLNKYFLD